MSDKKITPEIIRKMTPQEWENFRKESWQKKREYYAQPTPEWFLNNKTSYIEFLKRLNKRKEFVANGEHLQPRSLTEKVDILAGDEIDAFADDR